MSVLDAYFGLKLKVLIRFNITQLNLQKSCYISYVPLLKVCCDGRA